MALFTIGVTTYRRPEMLRECLISILEQSFGDFEVLVGNDYVPGPISAADLGVSDSRIRILNYEQNKGELPNMNFLLSSAKGKYFTWLADDDFLNIHALDQAQKALTQLGFPRSLFPFYRFVPDFKSVDRREGAPQPAYKLSSHEFLEGYLSLRLPITGCYGFFQSSYLNGKGGMRQLGVGHSPYSDNLLAVEEAGGQDVAVLPFVTAYIRRHEQSISSTAKEIGVSETAQRDFVKGCRKVFLHPHLQGHVKKSDRLLARLCIYDYFSVLQKADYFPWKNFLSVRDVLVSPAQDPIGYLGNLLLIARLCVRVFFKRLFR